MNRQERVRERLDAINGTINCWLECTPCTEAYEAEYGDRDNPVGHGWIDLDADLAVQYLTGNAAESRRALEIIRQTQKECLLGEDHWALEERQRQIERQRRRREGFVYLIESGGLHKIGRSAPHNFPNRIAQYRTENPHGISLVAYSYVLDRIRAEHDLLVLAGRPVRGREWFRLEPHQVENLRQTLASWDQRS